ncbi:thiamine-phosphate pyrophosphorylase [Nocardioides daedukensis]|uniref:Thiamine-phosphate synthase n=1 Tax=Nocardioides daedukensis TaxID=634462 RepID=A0A7Y9UQ63_9ACTN|nr:thiamine-phosphate pyrophosphorylase [Nocardioides daedukensis]
MLARLFCLVDTTDDLTLLPEMAALGVDGFQVRAKAASTRELRTATESALATGACVVVNDRLDVALAAGAHGVHLGASDLPVAAARQLAPRLLIGATCRSARQVRQARADGADYAGFGPIFATTTKTGLPDPLGVNALREASGILPLIAIGGIDATTAGAARRAGAHGVAAIGAIWRHLDPLRAARELVEAVS